MFEDNVFDAADLEQKGKGVNNIVGRRPVRIQSALER